MERRYLRESCEALASPNDAILVVDTTNALCDKMDELNVGYTIKATSSECDHLVKRNKLLNMLNSFYSYYSSCKN